MAQDDTQLILAMPVGLPGEGVDAAAFFTTLGTRIEAAVTGSVISVWTDPDSQYSGICPMIKAAVWYVMSGGTGIDGSTPVTANTLYCKTWLWEYLKLRSSSGGDSALPSVIAFANVEESEVQTDMMAELTTNEKYANMTDQERIDGAAALIAGASRLVAEAGIRLGMGQVDGAHPNGWRKVMISLYDADLNLLDPSFYFTLWDSVGGELVENHPLISLVQGPITPVTAPVEGGTRVKITGTGLTDASTVTIGGTSATEIRVKPDGTGTVLYATVPAGAAGKADVVVDGTASAGAFAYIEDVTATAQAALASCILHLGELTDLSTLLAAAGALDDDTRADLRLELEQACRNPGALVEQRSRLAGAAALETAVEELFDSALSTMQSLRSAASTAIG